MSHPGRSGVLYDERAKCYTHIISFWLLFLEGSPDPKEPHSPFHKEFRRVVLANWSRILSRCVPGDQDLICRLRDFTLDKARKQDVERVIAWLKVNLQGYRSYIYWLYLRGVLQMDSNVPKDVLVRWKTYGFERYSLLSYEVAPVRTIAVHMYTYIFSAVLLAARSISLLS